MKKEFKKSLIIAAASLAVALKDVIIGFLQLPICYIGKETKFKENFNNVMQKANVESPNFKDKKISDIAMLGSHDALSYKINYFSKMDKNSNDTFANILNVIGKGALVRNTQAQGHSIYQQLNQGVRYIDLRVTDCDNTFYTSHNLISHSLKDSILDILKFLSENDGEVLLLHLVHTYPYDEPLDKLRDFLKDVKYDDKNIYSYTMKTTKDVSQLTYYEATNNGTQSRVFFIQPEDNYLADEISLGNIDSPNCKKKCVLKFKTEDDCNIYFKDTKVRSKWHNMPTTKGIIDGITKESEYILKNKVDGFRVNQAQTTPSMKNPMSYLVGWSLLDMASKHNSSLFKKIDHNKIFSLMPIYMIDYTTCTKDNFNSTINKAILKFNVSN